MAIDWGNVPAWVSATGSVATFGTVMLGAKQLKLAVEQQRYRDLRDAQDQASKIAVWLTCDRNEYNAPTPNLAYVNTSGLPARNLIAIPIACPGKGVMKRIVEPTDNVHIVHFENLEEWVYERAKQQAERLPEELDQLGEATRFRYSNESLKSIQIDIRAQDIFNPILQQGVIIQFDDQYGTVWRRRGNSPLQEVNRNSDIFIPFPDSDVFPIPMPEDTRATSYIEAD